MHRRCSRRSTDAASVFGRCSRSPSCHDQQRNGSEGRNQDHWQKQALARALTSFFRDSSTTLLGGYSDTALRRVWKAQNFSYWMTSMLHTRADATSFERKRTLGELTAITESRYGQQYLAEGYTGWPSK